MPEYIKDREQTIERLADLWAAVQFAEYELAAGAALARTLGLSWDELARAFGHASKAGARNWYTRSGREALGGPGVYDPDERRRIGRLLGVGERVSRFEVRVIVSGKPGVSKVTRKMLSRHLDEGQAAKRALLREPAGEVWRCDPDGTAVMVTDNPAKLRRMAAKARRVVSVDGDAGASF